jgi:hypothetical protein
LNNQPFPQPTVLENTSVTELQNEENAEIINIFEPVLLVRKLLIVLSFPK